MRSRHLNNLLSRLALRLLDAAECDGVVMPRRLGVFPRRGRCPVPGCAMALHDSYGAHQADVDAGEAVLAEAQRLYDEGVVSFPMVGTGLVPEDFDRMPPKVEAPGEPTR